jgi:hypothetical protein
MTNRLLDRQANLLAYLTSGAAIFGNEGAVALDQGLGGFDRKLLRLEACFSHEKRIGKISAVFPRTLRMLGDPAAIIQEFAQACPPGGISRLENARQFHDFLSGGWQRSPPTPRYLPDVAACEFALACARGERATTPAPSAYAARDAVRRRPGVILLKCAYNVRPIFEEGAESAIERTTLLAIATPSGTEHPGVFELLPAAFDVLQALDHWTDLSALRSSAEWSGIVRVLAGHGLVEVHG